MQISVPMRFFRSLNEKIGAANRPPDDADRIRMHVDTPIEINRTQKIALANLTLFACMHSLKLISCESIRLYS